MSFGIWCLIVGGAAWAASYFLKDLFVDSSDADNPLRAVVVWIGYAGLVAGVYGAVLIAVQLFSGSASP